MHEKRKTLNGEDILWAFQQLGFDNYNETLKLYLQKYRDSYKIDRAKASDVEEQYDMMRQRQFESSHQFYQ